MGLSGISAEEQKHSFAIWLCLLQENLACTKTGGILFLFYFEKGEIFWTFYASSNKGEYWQNKTKEEEYNLIFDGSSRIFPSAT